MFVSIVLGRLSWYSRLPRGVQPNRNTPFQSSLDVSLGTRSVCQCGGGPTTFVSIVLGRLSWYSQTGKPLSASGKENVSIVLGRLSWYSLLVHNSSSTRKDGFNRPWTSLLVLAEQVMVIGAFVFGFNRPWTSLLVLAPGGNRHRHDGSEFQSSLDVSLGTRKKVAAMDMGRVKVSIVLGRLSWYSLAHP